MLKQIVFATLATCVFASVKQAVVILKADGIDGRVLFTQTDNGVNVEGNITGLATGKHGFHIHQQGDLGDSCVGAGGHFNPDKKDHGAPTDDNRHVGDLGNILAEAGKVTTIKKSDKLISLNGPNSIVGRALVIHSGEDDLGLGGYDDSKTTGHAGSRLTCGVVGILDEDEKDSNGAGSIVASSLVILTTLFMTLTTIF